MARSPLRLEELGARVLPSATPLPAPHPYVIQGQADGSFSARPPMPDVGARYDLSGAGRFLGLDQVAVSGWVRSVGSVAKGKAAGSLTLTSEKGTLTLTLTGPRQPSFAAMPSLFTYTASGTGGYARVTGTGSLTLMTAASPGGGKPHGSFALVVGQLARPAVALDGTLGGTIVAAPDKVKPPMVPDFGVLHAVNGKGDLLGESGVSVSGWLRSTGFVQGSHAEGQLTISGPTGSVTLGLVGPVQGAFAPLPGQFSLVVRSGSGAFAGLHAVGHVDLRLEHHGSGFTLSILA